MRILILTGSRQGRGTPGHRERGMPLLQVPPAIVPLAGYVQTETFTFDTTADLRIRR